MSTETVVKGKAKGKRKHKHYVLDEAKIRRAKKLLGVETETEAIERALDEMIAERERNKIIQRAHERFEREAKKLIKEGHKWVDVYGVLEGPSLP
jgi:hypothetical protein